MSDKLPTPVDLTPPTPLWARANTGALQDNHAMQVAREWLASEAWGLLLLGAVGRGKSQAAAWLWLQLRHLDLLDADALHRPRRGVLWLRARVLQRLDWPTRAQVLQRCAGAYGLVVDEMGGEDEKTGEALGDLIEQRGDEQRRTVLTTNLAPSWTDRQDGQGQVVKVPGFAQRYGDRLTSRLRSGGITDKGSARWAVAVKGADLRGADIPTTPAPDAEAEPDGAHTPATTDFMARELADKAPSVAALLQPLVEAARAAGGGT